MSSRGLSRRWGNHSGMARRVPPSLRKVEVVPTRKKLGRSLLRLETASLLIAVVIVVAMLGSLFPQLSSSAESDSPAWRDAVRARYGGWADLLLAVGVFRFSRSPLFLVPVGLLTLTTVACAISRWSSVIRRASRRPASLLAPSKKAAPLAAEVPSFADQGTQLVRLHSWLRRRWFKMRQETVGDRVVVLADRNRWAGSATLVTHLSIILLLVGAILSTILGWERRLEIPFGETVFIDESQPIALRNDGFRIERHADGSPALFEAQVTVLDRELPSSRANLRVNQPLKYRGYTVYLDSYWGEVDRYGLILVVARDPGYVPFLLGGILLVVGVTFSLYFPHSQVSATIEADGSAWLGGWPARYDWGLHREFPRLIEVLQGVDARGDGRRAGPMKEP